ncbi:MAG: hypothetical protein JXN64_02210 [Spirochaetes bacterium]|nr:hypothetical protein [Spirochaetota bacterium]
MDSIQKLEESMKVLDTLSVFLAEDSDYYIESEEIRILLQDVFEKIRDIYESLNDGEHII